MSLQIVQKKMTRNDKLLVEWYKQQGHHVLEARVGKPSSILLLLVSYLSMYGFVLICKFEFYFI